MPKDTKTLGNNKARAWESLGFVHKKRLGQRFDTTSSCILYYLFLRTGREGTLFPPFLLLRFLLLLLDLHFSHNLL